MDTYVIMEYPMNPGEEGIKPSTLVWSQWPDSFGSMRQAMDTIQERVSAVLRSLDLTEALLKLAKDGIPWYDTKTDGQIPSTLPDDALREVERAYGLCPYNGMAYVVTKVKVVTNHDNVVPLTIIHKQ